MSDNQDELPANFRIEDIVPNYSELLDMEVEFVTDLGHTETSLREILKLEKGSVIDLNKPAGGIGGGLYQRPDHRQGRGDGL